MRRAFIFLLACGALGVAQAQDPLPAQQTVCTITVNSTDERDAFRRFLPPDRYRFVELVEHGRPDWLASACEARVQCDVLVVSGHFAGTEFYSSKPSINETLKVDEMQRRMCSDSCPGVFANLKEVYLFGCDTLKPEPVKSATPEIVRALLKEGRSPADAQHFARALSERFGESSRDVIRRLFAHVPVIYGFASLAPLGRYSGPMLERYLDSGPDAEIGSGRVSPRLLALFGPSSMVATNGQSDDEPYSTQRVEACRSFDERLTSAQHVEAIHAALAADSATVRMSFDRVEKFFADLPAHENHEAATSRALQALALDRAAAGRFESLTRDTHDPALRLRMIALARGMGWLDAQGERGEKARLVRDVVLDPAMAYGEVELVCSLNGGGTLDDALDKLPPARTFTVAQAAGVACLGNASARARVLKALASTQEADVQAAQAYLRHRPIDDAAELRTLAADVSRMKNVNAQVRALDTLGRHHITDALVVVRLADLFQRTHSIAVQRAIAEIFLRTGPAVVTPEVLATLRQHRIAAPGMQPDLIDLAIQRLSS